MRLNSTHTLITKDYNTHTHATMENQSPKDATCIEYYTHTDLEFERDLTEKINTITTKYESRKSRR